MQEPFALFQVSEFLLDLCTLHKPQRKFKTMLSLSLHYLPSKISHFFLPWFHTQFHDFPPLPIEEDPWAKASLHYLQNENPFFFFFFSILVSRSILWFFSSFHRRRPLGQSLFALPPKRKSSFSSLLASRSILWFLSPPHKGVGYTCVSGSPAWSKSEEVDELM